MHFRIDLPGRDRRCHCGDAGPRRRNKDSQRGSAARCVGRGCGTVRESHRHQSHVQFHDGGSGARPDRGRRGRGPCELPPAGSSEKSSSPTRRKAQAISAASGLQWRCMRARRCRMYPRLKNLSRRCARRSRCRSPIRQRAARRGQYFSGLLQRLGVADDIKGKAVLSKGGRDAAERVARGEAEIGITFPSEGLRRSRAQRLRACCRRNCRIT